MDPQDLLPKCYRWCRFLGLSTSWSAWQSRDFSRYSLMATLQFTLLCSRIGWQMHHITQASNMSLAGNQTHVLREYFFIYWYSCKVDLSLLFHNSEESDWFFGIRLNLHRGTICRCCWSTADSIRAIRCTWICSLRRLTELVLCRLEKSCRGARCRCISVFAECRSPSTADYHEAIDFVKSELSTKRDKDPLPTFMRIWFHPVLNWLWFHWNKAHLILANRKYWVQRTRLNFSWSVYPSALRAPSTCMPVRRAPFISLHH